MADSQTRSSNLDEAKRWFEAAAMIARIIPDGEAQAQQVSHRPYSLRPAIADCFVYFQVEKSYRELLARYGNRSN